MEWESADGKSAKTSPVANEPGKTLKTNVTSNGSPQAPGQPNNAKPSGDKSFLSSKKFRVIAGVVAVIILLNVVNGVRSCISNIPKNFSWPTTGLAVMLPTPKSSKGEVSSNSSKEFRATVAKTSKDGFNSYVSQCEDMGFNVDEEEEASSFEAYNSDGYKLELSYSDYHNAEEMTVHLSIPVEMGDMAWPTSGVGALAPVPVSTTGKIETESSSTFSVYIGKTSLSDYATYVQSCINAGFDVDYSKHEKSFTAENANGVDIRVTYKGFNMMSVHVYADSKAQEAMKGGQSTEQTEQISTDQAQAQAETQVTQQTEEATPAQTKTTDASSSAVPSGTVTPSFKEYMDGYESFMNSYVEFMKKYKNASSAEIASMLTDYSTWMTKYSEWIDKLDDIDVNTLSAADYAYYFEVYGRVMQKIAEL